MSLEEEQASTAETSPEPGSQKAPGHKKPKRLTLQERLAAAAKSKRKKAEIETEPETEPETAPEVADLGVSKPDDSKGGKVEKPSNSEGGEVAEQVPSEPIEAGESVGESTAEVVNPDAQTETDVVTDVETTSVDTEGTPGESPPADKQTEESAQPRGETPDMPGAPSGPPEVAECAVLSGEEQQTEKSEETPAANPEIDSLKSEVAALKTQLEQQKKDAAASTRRAPPNSAEKKALAEKDKLIAQLEKKVRDRDSTVQQLMDEGQELSKKELKLNERVRSLATNNTKLEASLRSYADKNEESLLKLGEIEDLIKSHKLKSVDQLFEVLAASSQKVAELQNSLDKLRESNWEGKYKEVQRLYERELDEKREVNRRLGESSVQLELLQNQSRLELQSKSDIIAQLSREIMASKDESSTEVLRLEAKIEHLRMENENFLKGSQGGEPDTAADGHLAAKKHVDYADFVKLSDTHQNLQAQYAASQANWKLIESSLSSKVDALSASVETLKKAKAKSAAELKKVHAQMNLQVDEIEHLKSDLARAKQELAEQEFQTQMKQGEVQEMEEKLEELKTVFASDRKNYDIKIKNLSESIQSYESVSQAQTPTFTPAMSYDNLANMQSSMQSGIQSGIQSGMQSGMQSGLQTRRGFRDSGLHIHMDSRVPISRKFSSHSVASSALNTPAHGWDEASFLSGAPETPLYQNHNTSSLSFGDDIYPFDAPEPDADTPSHQGLHSAGSGATKHIQIINKMSSSIRRLEAEIYTLKDENVHLSAQKESAQRELLNRFELDKKVAALEERIAVLQQEIAEKAKKEETLLEVIGEKSERVGELEADVVDLKDLLRSQVQQMIEMHNK